MGTFGMAGLRYPAAMAASLGITFTLFWALWALTDKTFPVLDTVPVQIELTRTRRETPTETKRQEKVQRERPSRIAELPPLRAARDAGPPVATFSNHPQDLVLPPDSRTMGSDSEPVPMFRVQPIYPPGAAARGMEGWVLVQFDIAASGAVTNVAAVDSEPEMTFDKAATDAVARWRYNPAVVKGQAVERVGVQTLLRFTLKDAE